MDFDPKPEHELFRKSIRDFAKREIAPLVDEAEATETFPRQLLPRMGELGFLCITCPEQYGGPGGDIMTQAIFSEEVAYVSLGICIGTLVHSAYAGSLLAAYGSEEQKHRYLPDAVKGRKIWAFAGTEPDAGSDRSRVRTTIRKEGDEWILNGSKIWITNPGVADYVIVEGYTDRSQGLKGLSLFILPKGTPGFTVKNISKVGIRSSEYAELHFDNCVLPADAQLGEQGGAFEKVNRIRTASWILVGARAIGVSRAAYDASLEHAKTRVQFGRPIGHFQANSFKLADMALDLEIARLLTCKAAWLHDQGRECFKEASMAKLFTTEMAVRITGQALQLHGAFGYSSASPISRYFRDAKMLTISEGSSEIQHIHIARQLGLVGDDFHRP